VKVVGVFQSFQFNYDDLAMISVVIPIFNEQENLPALRNRLAAAMETCGEDWEVIFVDDGSRDESSQILLRFHEDDPRLKILTLSRNFGHQPAVTAGIHYAKGDCVVLIDGDLQDPPEVIPEMIRQWQQGFQVVVGERASRSDRGARGLGMRLFYPILRRVTDLPNAANAGIFGLMDRAVIDEFNKLSERNRFIPGLRSWLGFKQTTVRYDRGDRAAGKPKQSLPKLVNYAADAMISFSYKPLRAATWLGFLVSVFSFAMGIFYIVTFFEWHKPITGFTTEIVSILFLGGVQLISIGILGEYIGRIYEEVKHRPLYIVRESVGMKNGGG
jgi:glycosyltransferase involved in cell wall biosynthesis